jgi:hypothetical protein
MRHRLWSPIRALVVAICFALGVWLASHHPLGPVAAVAVFVAWCAASYRWPHIAFAALPAIIPIVDLAPWTGWIIVEEFDLLLLGAVAGTYASIAFGPQEQLRQHSSRLFHVVTLLFLGSILAALVIGVEAARDTPVSWFAGYLDSLNSLRIGKAFCFAYLMLVPMRAEMERSNGSLPGLMIGLAVGFALATLAVLWERASYVGILDFSSDYRVTGLFWEMHVGGAALDGFLVLTLPFAVREWLRSRRRKKLIGWAIVIILGAYACVATFSRGVLLAVPMSMVALLILELRRRRKPGDASHWRRTTTLLAFFIIGTAFASWLAFRHGGYRAMFALTGVAALALPLMRAAQMIRVGRFIAVALSSGCITGLFLLGAMHIPKGPYALYGMVFGVGGFLAWKYGHSTERARVINLAAFIGLVVASVGVAMYWGGIDALVESAIANASIAASVVAYAHARPVSQRDDLMSWSAMLGGIVLASCVVAIFSGGPYLEGRVASAQTDLDSRIAHWRRVIGLLDSPKSWLVGKGLGRLPSTYFFSVDNANFPGSFRLEESGGNRYVILSGLGHPTGFGELFRLSQRVPTIPRAKYSVTLLARAPRDVLLELEICEKHLLYGVGCATTEIALKANPVAWQRISVLLDGREIHGGPWYAPRLAFFSLAVDSAGQRIELDDVRLSAVDGKELLVNGDFSQEMAHWFFTSDREHLAWHAKSLVLNVLFDQGIVGLGLFVMLVVGALWRLLFVVYRHTDAPYVASALIGFLIIGLFDSLLDVPRVAFLFYLLLFVAIVLPRMDFTASSPDVT